MKPSRYTRAPLSLISMIFLWIITIPCVALEPHEIVVIANKNVPDGVTLAQFYIKKRNIPKVNLLQLEISEGEECTREEYNEKVVQTVRKYLEKKNLPPTSAVS